MHVAISFNVEMCWLEQTEFLGGSAGTQCLWLPFNSNDSKLNAWKFPHTQLFFIRKWLKIYVLYLLYVMKKPQLSIKLVLLNTQYNCELEEKKMREKTCKKYEIWGNYLMLASCAKPKYLNRLNIHSFACSYVVCRLKIKIYTGLLVFISLRNWRSFHFFFPHPFQFSFTSSSATL